MTLNRSQAVNWPFPCFFFFVYLFVCFLFYTFIKKKKNRHQILKKIETEHTQERSKRSALATSTRGIPFFFFVAKARVSKTNYPSRQSPLPPPTLYYYTPGGSCCALSNLSVVLSCTCTHTHVSP